MRRAPRFAVLILMLISASFASGAAVVHLRHPAYNMIIQLGQHLEGYWAPEQIWHVETVLLNFKADAVTVQMKRPIRGGALTAFAGGALLLTGSGELFYASGPENLLSLAVAPPATGREALATLKHARDDLWIEPDRLRFNDILVLRYNKKIRLWLSHTFFDAINTCFQSVVSELTLPHVVDDPEEIFAAAEDWRIIFRTDPCLPLKDFGRAVEGHQAGGRFAAGTDGRVYLTVGNYALSDYGPETALSQSPTAHYGKILALDAKTGIAEIISAGHRNPQGIAFDSKGDLWESEHGLRGGDELNLIFPGRNYGFPFETLGTTYSGLPLFGALSYGRHDNFEAPRLAWLPSIAPSSLALIRDLDPAWNGDLLLGTLKDMSLHRIRISDRRVIYDEAIPLRTRIRYALPLPGRIVVWTDDGQLIWLTPISESPWQRATGKFLATYKGPLNDAAVEAAIATCVECHPIGPSLGDQPPGLATIAGRPRPGGGIWDRRALKRMILDPVGTVPESKMPDPGIDDPETVEVLVDYLIYLGRGSL